MTALTITQPDIRLKKNGGAWGQKNAAQTLTHEENGNYEVSFDATDSNTLGTLRLHVNEPGALPVWDDFMVMPANVWDAMFGADRLQVDALEWASTLIPTPPQTGVPLVDLSRISGSPINPTTAQLGVNVVQISDDPVAATNAEAFFDGTGYAGTNNVIPTVSTVTNLVSANVTQISGDATAADNLEAEYDGTGYKSYLRRNTAQGGGASTIQLDAGAAGSDDFYNGLVIGIVGGLGAGQGNIITDYVGATKQATVNTPWIQIPNNTSIFALFAFGSIPGATAPTAAQVADEVQIRTIAAVTTVNGLAANAITATAIQNAAFTEPKFAAGAFTAAKFAAGAFDAVWTVATRLLTAGTNIVLAKGTGLTGLNDLSAADVNTEVVDALNVDTYAELGQTSPPATVTITGMLRWMYKLARNLQRTNSNTGVVEVLNDAGTVVDNKATVTDAGGITTVGKFVPGP